MPTGKVNGSTLRKVLVSFSQMAVAGCLRSLQRGELRLPSAGWRRCIHLRSDGRLPDRAIKPML
jgi:hypothetical protein